MQKNVQAAIWAIRQIDREGGSNIREANKREQCNRELNSRVGHGILEGITINSSTTVVCWNVTEKPFDTRF